MSPIPPPFHNGLSPITARQDKPNGLSATPLELILITVALLISSVLAFTPKRRSIRKQPRNPVFSRFIIIVALLFTAAAFTLALATLVLGWLRIISLDAVAGIVFALGPAFVSIPLEILTYWQDSLTSRKMWANASLNIKTSQFRYIRFLGPTEHQKEQQCAEITKSDLEDDPKLQDKPARWCGDETIMVIRFMQHPSRSDCLSVLFNKLHSYVHSRTLCTDPTTCSQRKSITQRRGSQWNHIYGNDVHTYNNFSTMQDIDDGITSWWWSGVSSARHLVARPAVVHLATKDRVVNALALLSDIISIGDLVLYFHQSLFQNMLHYDPDVRAAVTSAPGFSCNRILRELEMDGWDSIGTEVLESNFQFSAQSSKKYSIMFLILAEKSQRFLKPEQNEENLAGEFVSGQTVLDKLWDACDEINFCRTAKDSVDEWLESWGLNTHKQESLMSIYEPLRQELDS